MDDEYTRAERVAAWVGVAAGLVLVLVSLDVATGGMLSARRAARYRWDEATAAEQEGGTP